MFSNGIDFVETDQWKRLARIETSTDPKDVMRAYEEAKKEGLEDRFQHLFEKEFQNALKRLAKEKLD